MGERGCVNADILRKSLENSHEETFARKVGEQGIRSADRFVATLYGYDRAETEETLQKRRCEFHFSGTQLRTETCRSADTMSARTHADLCETRLLLKIAVESTASRY